MEGLNNEGIKNLSLETALNVVFFCCVWGGVGENGEGKQVFAFGSLVQVKFIPEIYTWKRKGWKDSSCGNTFNLFPSYSFAQRMPKRKSLVSPSTRLALCSVRKPHPERGKVFFEQKKPILPCLKHPPSHQTHQYLFWSPKGLEWLSRCCNQIKLHS